MSRPLRLVAFAGSTRRESFNRRLLAVAAALVREEGAEVDVVELAEVPLPLYQGDLEKAEGIPAPARELHARMAAADGLLLACPEYNTSITPLLKNTLDWLSRAEPDNPSQGSAFEGKVAALLSASPGALGGLRSLSLVRPILQTLGVLVVPAQFALSRAGDAFSEDGSLKADAARERVRGVVHQLIRIATALRNPGGPS